MAARPPCELSSSSFMAPPALPCPARKRPGQERLELAPAPLSLPSAPLQIFPFLPPAPLLVAAPGTQQQPCAAPLREPPSSLFVVVPTGRSSKCAASRALPARCFVKPCGQHAADAHRGLLFLRSPFVVVVHPR
uniref:Uncharacterized protein n=1 Tax=Zea mays TaxID=4577 RepID=A0A804PGM3_MAIZE